MQLLAQFRKNNKFSFLTEAKQATKRRNLSQQSPGPVQPSALRSQLAIERGKKQGGKDPVTQQSLLGRSEKRRGGDYLACTNSKPRSGILLSRPRLHVFLSLGC